MARIHDLENEIERLKTSLSKSVSSDPEKSRHDQTAARASLEKQYRQELNSLNQKLKSRISQLESIRDLRDADAKKYQGASARDQQRIADLEKQIASFSTLRHEHGAERKDQKRELDRLRKVIAGVHSENARLQRKIQDRENACDVVIADRDLAVADRDKLWDHLAQLASGFSFAVASAPASSDSKRNRSDRNSGLSSKRSRVSGDSSHLTPTSTSTRSARSKSSAGHKRSSPATRSADTVQTDASKPRDKIQQSGKPTSRINPTKSTPSPRSTLLTRSTRSASADNSAQSAESLRAFDPPKSTASAPVAAPARSSSHEKLAGSTRSSKFKRSV